MGYNISRLAIIKARLSESNQDDVKSMIKFLDEEIIDTSSDSVYQIKEEVLRLKSDPNTLSHEAVEFILDFIIEQIPLNRLSDKAATILGNMDKTEFYSRELRYSKIEKFVFSLITI